MLAVRVSPETTVQEIRILGETATGQLFPEQLITLHEGKPLSQSNLGDSWRSAILYYAVIDRFANGSEENDMPVTGVPELSEKANWQGGDLQAALDVLD